MKTKGLIITVLSLTFALALLICPIIAVSASAADDVTVSFTVSPEVAKVSSMSTTAGGSITLPTSTAPEGYTFVGWCDTEIKSTTTKPTFYAAGSAYTVNASTTLYALYSSSGGASTTATLVTNTSTLAVGDKIIIAAKDYDVAMSTTQNNNNRGQADITKSGNSIAINDSLAIFTLGEGKVDGTFSFYDPNKAGYLYAASSSSNYLKTKSALDTNGSWLITISDGATSIVAKGDKTRNDLRYNPSTSNGNLFSCYASTSTQKAIVIYEVDEPATIYETATGCAHKNTSTATVNATCTEDGSVTVTCTDCEITVSTEILSATGHLNTEILSTDATCLTNGIQSTVCNDCDTELSVSFTPVMNGHSFSDGICTECGYKIIESDDLSGRYYIAGIRNRRENYYQFVTSSLTSGTTKRYATEESTIAKDGKFTNEIMNPESNKVFVLEKNSDGTYYIYAEGIDEDAKYLGWNSGNSGAFVTKEEARALSISLNSETGMFNISFVDEDTTRYFSINGDINYDYAAWYTSEQIRNIALIPVIEAKISAASINIGETLSMKYYVTLGEGKSISDYSMRFTMNGRTTTVSEYIKAEDGRYVFTFSGIAPQCMGDEIAAELIVGGKTVYVKDGYSVLDNAKNLLDKNPSDKLKALIYDMLIYGAAAQKYVDYKTDMLVTDGIEGLTASESAPTEASRSEISESTSEDIYFLAAGVYFDYNNKIYIKIKALDSSDLTVTVNGKAMDLEGIGDGVYVAYTEALTATEFDNVLTFTITKGDSEIQTLTYSIASYAYAKWNASDDGGRTLTKMAELARALYRYGASAEAYLDN